MNINELQLIARTGDQKAEDRLFELLSARFRLFAKRSIRNDNDCKEIVQDTLMTILGKYKDIEFTTSFIGWSHQVLKNKILNYGSRKSRHRDVMERTEGDYHSDEFYEPDPDFEKKLLGCFDKINRKNNRYARAINLNYQGFPVEDICLKLKLTRNNFYSILSRARSMLQFCLERGNI